MAITISTAGATDKAKFVKRFAWPAQLLALTLVATIAPNALQAAEPNSLTAEDCAQLVDRTARLACFDQIFGSTLREAPDASTSGEAATSEAPAVLVDSSKTTYPPSAQPRTAPVIASESLQAEQPVEPTAQAPRATPSGAAGRNETSATAAEAEPENRGRLSRLFNRGDKVEIESRVAALRARDKQRMVFLLENGEMWMQTSPRDLPIKKGDALTIKSGLMGGYVMRTEHGVSTRVHRIN